MKKMFIVAFLLLGSVTYTNAQVNGKAIGLRFGGITGYGAEISYQHPLSYANRMEIDLGWNYFGLGAAGIYHWVWNLSELADGFKWYVGIGAGLGMYDYGYKYGGTRNNVFNLGLAGQVGIEYNFNIPIQLSLDYRPVWYVLNSGHFSADGIAFAIRYKF